MVETNVHIAKKISFVQSFCGSNFFHIISQIDFLSYVLIVECNLNNALQITPTRFKQNVYFLCYQSNAFMSWGLYIFFLKLFSD